MSYEEERRRRDAEDAARQSAERESRRRDDLADAARREEENRRRGMCQGCGFLPKSNGPLCGGCHEQQVRATSATNDSSFSPAASVYAQPDYFERYDAANRYTEPTPEYLDPYSALTDAERDLERVVATAQLEQAVEMDRLWERAVAGCDDASLQRNRFWMLINESAGPDAAGARDYLREAGFRVGTGSEPATRTEPATPPTGADRQTGEAAPSVTIGCTGCGGMLTCVGGLCMSCLRHAADTPTRDAFEGQQGVSDRERTRAEERRIANLETSGLCMNLDGKAVVGRLCSSCAAQLREQEALSSRYQDAFSRPFADTFEVAALWQRASQDTEGNKRNYDTSRARFWALVTTDPAPEAAFVRNMLQAAGYDQAPGRAPVQREKTGGRAPGRDRSQRLLTIDHATPQNPQGPDGTPTRSDPTLLTGAENLRFMSGADNAERKNLFSVQDVPAAGWDAFWGTTRQALARLWAK